MPRFSSLHDLKTLIRSYHPLILIETVEAQRLAEILAWFRNGRIQVTALAWFRSVPQAPRAPSAAGAGEAAATVLLSITRREGISRFREVDRDRFVPVSSASEGRE